MRNQNGSGEMASRPARGKRKKEEKKERVGQEERIGLESVL
jgi:hypothetical protein